MIEVPAILSLFDNTTTRRIWEPLLSQFNGSIITLEASDNNLKCLTADVLNYTPQILIISSDLYTFRGKEIIRRLRTEYSNINIAILSAGETIDIPPWSIIVDNIRHLAVVDPVKESDNICALIRTLADNKPWELSSYLRLDSVLHEFPLFDPKGKEMVIDNIECLVPGPAPDLEMLRQKGVLLADEMIENALQAAPSGAIASQGIMIKAGFDGDTLALQVKDRWGTLTPEIAMDHLTRQQNSQACLEKARGRGLFILWQFFDHFHVNIESGKETAIGGQLKRKLIQMPGQLKGFDYLHISSPDRVHSQYN
jgi:anti-sigma regulatory factor (Ser/Thr protein kinase)